MLQTSHNRKSNLMRRTDGMGGLQPLPRRRPATADGITAQPRQSRLMCITGPALPEPCRGSQRTVSVCHCGSIHPAVAHGARELMCRLRSGEGLRERNHRGELLLGGAPDGAHPHIALGAQAAVYVRCVRSKAVITLFIFRLGSK